MKKNTPSSSSSSATTKDDELKRLEKYSQMKDSMQFEMMAPKVDHPLPVPRFDFTQYDTEHIRTVFRHIETGIECSLVHGCFTPEFKTSAEFSLTEPLFHPLRQKYVHEWLCKMGTPKYLEQIEEVAIYAKRLAQLAEGFYPLVSTLGDNPYLMNVVLQERLEKSCPLIHFRDLGNGFFVLVNVNDMLNFSSMMRD